MSILKATFAGGCFWCIEASFNHLNGVIEARSGYTGGDIIEPTYEQICTGKTGHAEAVQVTYDSTKISYTELLLIFFSLHDASQLNRQGADIGSQYRSAIFFHDLEQQKIANAFILQLQTDKVFDAPIVTEVTAFLDFYLAEDHHQGYFLRNPEQLYCTAVIAPKFNRFKERFKAQLKLT
ncbi:peptide methionine sulfoxide reductase [Psychromonas sp. CNPT3]|uniref:peptide-methionine (S)-S-oxide reductase MsrA n=1 Tax=Psychromonas sp. CNPT3 TaxID=314282 RepID=UPI00006E80C3|nr:peptide-methionine (S)-S-oxide reductase MsrA [Psychromonas sp. CNPT3]AGH80832.1 peptide methionine sulfoxide reductase [Psychromonas sp. CNPT3]